MHKLVLPQPTRYSPYVFANNLMCSVFTPSQGEDVKREGEAILTEIPATTWENAKSLGDPVSCGGAS